MQVGRGCRRAYVLRYGKGGAGGSVCVRACVPRECVCARACERACVCVCDVGLAVWFQAV